MNYWLLFLPALSGLLGWLIMRLAGKILVYRIIPRQQQQVAMTAGKAISAEFPIAELEKKIIDPGNIQKIMPLVETHIDDFLRNKLKEKMPMVSMFIGSKTIDSLKEVFLKEIEDLFPQVLKQFSGNLRSEIDIETMVANKITNVSASRIEGLFSPVLRYFEWMGAAAGLLIGLINVVIIFVV